MSKMSESSVIYKIFEQCIKFIVTLDVSDKVFSIETLSLQYCFTPSKKYQTAVELSGEWSDNKPGRISGATTLKTFSL
jgi:hypothetical protein